MAKKSLKKDDRFDLLKEREEVSKKELIEARVQEMQDILPGFQTNFLGEVIHSREIPQVNIPKKKSKLPHLFKRKEEK